MHRRLRRFSIALMAALVIAGCSSTATLDDTAPVATIPALSESGDDTASDAPNTNEVESAPDETVTPAPAPPATTVVPPESAAPDCADVPTFRAADTVSVACADGSAVAPELFASNAGWHLFEAQQDGWVEIDYARTCCEADDVPFVELLRRNGLGESVIERLCLNSGLGDDPWSGCGNDPAEGAQAIPADFEPTWLRVNGLGDHDFATNDAVALAGIEAVFGPPVSVSENGECGAGAMTIASWDDFSVNFQSGQLVGWFYESSAPALTSPSGVAPGISEADLRVVYDGVDIREDSLGREFFFEVPAGFMGGFLDGQGGEVTAMFAGVTCFFR